MSKIFSALLIALSLTATVACDDPDSDKKVDDTGDDSTGGEDDSTTSGDTAEVETTAPATTEDEEKPGCFNGNLLQLPPTGGPNGTLGDNC